MTPAVRCSLKAVLIVFCVGVLSACGGGASAPAAGPAAAEGKPVALAEASAKGAELNALDLQAAQTQAETQNTRPADSLGRLAEGEIAPLAAYLSGAVAQKAAANTVPVYRFFNRQTGAHFYTISEAERDRVRNTLPNMNYEGPAFSAVSAAAPGLSPVYRFYNVMTSVHFYTISESERAHVVANFPQFQFEGVAYYASQVAGAGFTPLFRFYHRTQGFHFYTNSENERDSVVANLKNIYNYEGIGYYVPGSGAPPVATSNPMLFVTQVPHTTDFAARMSTFGNHQAQMNHVTRGGDLYIRYPDGGLRNLTQEAGFGMTGFQGANSIAVREPSVHWSGSKALFSMVVGAPTVPFDQRAYRWQIFEVQGLARGETASIRKVDNQPGNYNNISPVYGTDDRVLFTSDRPRGGQAHLYPQLDEYESTPTVSGLWSLNPATNDLRLLNHSPSGVFSPSIDSAGRVIFTRWDHLQRDQQGDGGQADAKTFSSEAVNATDQGNVPELFPEPRFDHNSAAYGTVKGHRSNFFTPWQINQDGSDEETLNHVGRHELSFQYLPQSFANDGALSEFVSESFRANRKALRDDGGLLHLREDPTRSGTFFATYAREFGALSTNQIVKLTGGTAVNPRNMTVVDVTPTANEDGTLTGGRFRNPLPMSDGSLVASHTPTTASNSPATITQIRLKNLVAGAGGLYQAGTSLTPGIRKAVSWLDDNKPPSYRSSYDGLLWELEAVEVVARARPAPRTQPTLQAPERTIFTAEGVNEADLRQWLVNNELALIVTRNQTSRDQADKQQPFNLRVPGGISTVGPGNGRIYDISHFQVFQADQVRGYQKPGRRVRAMPMQPRAGVNAANPANPGGPASSVPIASDGSTAAFVPARRALSWQSTDAGGNAVVRERVWITLQPGEVRVCASCHGENTTNQAGGLAPINPPEALRTLLRHWKNLPK